jgi:hypothetical protein
VRFEVRALDTYSEVLQSYLSVDGEPPQEMTFSGLDAEGNQLFEITRSIGKGDHEAIVFTRDEHDYFSDNQHLTFSSQIEAPDTSTTVEIDSMTVDQDPLDIRVLVDDTAFYTPVSLELEQGSHRMVPQRFKFHASRIYVFDHWLDETGSFVSDNNVLTQQFNEDTSLIAVYATLFQRLRNILSLILD